MVAYYLFLTVPAAVKAEHTFANPYISARLTAAFTGALAQFAIGAFSLVFADSPDGKSAKDGEQRAQRTDESTVKSGDDEVKEDRSEKY